MVVPTSVSGPEENEVFSMVMSGGLIINIDYMLRLETVVCVVLR